MNSENENLPLNPPSIITLGDAAPAGGRKIRLSEPEEIPAETGMIKITKDTLTRLSNVGIMADNIGVLKIASGTVFTTIEGCDEVEQAIRTQIREAVARGDFEAIAQLSAAFANIIKAKAAMLKAAGGFQSSSDKDKRPRKTFGKGSPLGPVVDVKAA